MLAGCSDGGVQTSFFPAGVSEADAATGDSNDASTGGSTSGASEATMIDPTEGLTTGQSGSTSGPAATSDPDPTAATAPTEATSSESGDPTSSGSSGMPADGEKCTDEEVELIGLVNAYRMQNGLPAVPINEHLCAVAHIHAVDLEEQAPQNTAGCDLHSWSNAGAWTPCCYTEDLAQAACMWAKPAELTPYPGNGHEMAAAATDPATALAMMQSVTYDNALMLNIGLWESQPWRSVGAAIHGGHALVWFGPTPP